jgi:hypothetical protein
MGWSIQMTHFLEEYMRGSVAMRKHGNIHVPEGYDYTCFEDYVLRNGAPLSSSALTDEEEQTVKEALDRAVRVGVDVHEMKQCFANSQTLLLMSDEPDLMYYEGYATGRAGFPVHHGWVGINGKVVDLTWLLKEPNTSRSVLPQHPVGELPENWLYWGVPFENLDYIRFRVTTRELIGSLLDDMEGNYPLLRGIDPNDDESWMDFAAEVEEAL